MTRLDSMKTALTFSAGCRSAFQILIIILAAGIQLTGGQTYKVLGCYIDSVQYPDLSGSKQVLANMTQDSCIDDCLMKEFPYAGLQDGNECFCGDTYGTRGSSTSGTCNITCVDGTNCGGYLSNSVSYTVDTSITDRVEVLNLNANSFTNARHNCIGNGGEVATPNSKIIVQSMVALWQNNSGVVAAWVGLYLRSGVLAWTDETLPAYYPQATSYASYWTTGDTQQGPCVSLVFATGLLQSITCSTALPFICNQSPSATQAVESMTNAPASTDIAATSKQLALYIVLPIFLFCYGGSCILYCVHKIIKNCTRKPQKKMALDQVESGGQTLLPVPQRQMGPPPMVGGIAYVDNPQPLKRPYSAGKRIYPTPYGDPAAAIAMPTKTMPVYVPGAPPKQMAEYKPPPINTPRPTTSSGIQIGLEPLSPSPKEESPAPPPYADKNEERRQRLLDNAAQQSRDRRLKDEAEGRPSSRPFDSAPKREGSTVKSPAPAPPGANQDSPHDSPPQSARSTANLLGKDDENDDGNNPLSINEILKQKMQDKKNKTS